MKWRVPDQEVDQRGPGDTLAKKKKVKTSDHKVITVAADRELFGRLVISAESRDVILKDILS